MNGYCDHKDCGVPSDVHPVLLIFPPLLSEVPARGRIFREYCRPHGQALTVEHFVTEDGWKRICGNFKTLGKITPDRSRLQLIWEPVMHAERN